MKRLIEDGYVVSLDMELDDYYLPYLLETIFEGFVYRDADDENGDSTFIIYTTEPLSEEEIDELNFNIQDHDFEGEHSFEGLIVCKAEERGIQVTTSDMDFYYPHESYDDLISLKTIWNDIIRKRRSVAV